MPLSSLPFQSPLVFVPLVFCGSETVPRGCKSLAEILLYRFCVALRWKRTPVIRTCINRHWPSQFGGFFEFAAAVGTSCVVFFGCCFFFRFFHIFPPSPLLATSFATKACVGKKDRPAHIYTHTQNMSKEKIEMQQEREIVRDCRVMHKILFRISTSRNNNSVVCLRSG